MSENNHDNEIEQIENILQKFRPTAPSMELKERILRLGNRKKLPWIRYTAVAAAACVLIAVGGYFLVDRDTNIDTTQKPKEVQLSFAEIELKISQSGRAARLLAAADLLAKHSDTKQIVRNQYCYITERYPQTSAGIEAKLRIQSYDQ